MSSIQNKSVGIMREEDDKDSIRYCVECGAKMPKSQKICPACGESQ
ncbi:MAG TPA: zinc-ribbon domain-containing protein [Nitrososphaeraceae archaeon]|nr:zinc-ribbon domain-containing protein [Nitrososphaeraceae archaeon]